MSAMFDATEAHIAIYTEDWGKTYVMGVPLMGVYNPDTGMSELEGVSYHPEAQDLVQLVWRYNTMNPVFLKEELDECFSMDVRIEVFIATELRVLSKSMKHGAMMAPQFDTIGEEDMQGVVIVGLQRDEETLFELVVVKDDERLLRLMEEALVGQRGVLRILDRTWRFRDHGMITYVHEAVDSDSDSDEEYEVAELSDDSDSEGEYAAIADMDPEEVEAEVEAVTQEMMALGNQLLVTNLVDEEPESDVDMPTEEQDEEVDLPKGHEVGAQSMFDDQAERVIEGEEDSDEESDDEGLVVAQGRIITARTRRQLDSGVDALRKAVVTKRKRKSPTRWSTRERKIREPFNQRY